MNTDQAISVVVTDWQLYVADLDKYKHSLFITHEWVSSISPDSNVIYLHFMLGDEVIAKSCGLIINGSRIIGRYLMFYAAPGLLYHYEEMYNKVMMALMNFAKNNRFSKIDLMNFDQQHSWICSVKGFIRRGLAEYVRYFDGPDKPITFSKSLLNNVRKAKKVNPIYCEENSPRVLNRLHELLEETQRLRFHKYGKEYEAYPYYMQTKESTNRLYETGLLRLFHVEVEGVIHCVRCAMVNKNRMFGMMIASDEIAYKHGLQHYMQYCLMSNLHNQGYSYYNIAGAGPSKGLAEYKESLGCEAVPLYGVYTHFIYFPKTALNPLMRFGRLLASKYILHEVIAFVSRKIFGNKSM